MKKLLIILIGILTFNSCKTSEQSIYEGAWVDKKSEMVEISILNENNSYWLKDYKGKYPITKEMGDNFVIINSKKHSISIREGILNLSETVYIPEFKSLKKQFTGLWTTQSREITFEIKNINGGLIWDIKKGEGKAVRYYPKITDSGFTFTYDNEQLFFNIEDRIMKDSKGREYIRISDI